jgi:Tfp pilus assembly protein PilN
MKMINLLPKKEKEILIQEQEKRLIIILGIVILAALLCLILVLFSIKIYLKGKIEIQKIILEHFEKELKSSKLKEIKEELKLINQTFLKLNSFYQKKVDFTKILEKISKTLPKETFLTNLSLDLSAEREVICNLSGFAKNREVLLEFKKNLEANFQKVYFSPASWLKPTNFNVNFLAIFE